MNKETVRDRVWEAYKHGANQIIDLPHTDAIKHSREVNSAGLSSAFAELTSIVGEIAEQMDKQEG